MIEPAGRCRVCGSRELAFLFSLGEMYVSDFVPPERVTAGPRCPVELELCRSCTLAQMRHTAPQDFLYTRHYWYRSGVTATMRAALADVALAAGREAGLSPGDVVLDIGSNTGELLRSYSALGLVKVGVEPASNLAEEGRRGLDVFIPEFWSEAAYLRAVGRPAKAVTACGMAYDLDDPATFFRDVARVLHPDGVFIAQLMCLKQTVELADVGNLSHEHLEYYSLRSLMHLYQSCGLRLYDLEENDVNGGSYRLYARRADSPRGLREPASARLLSALEREREMRLDEEATYSALFRRMRDNRDRCVSFLRREHAAGKRIHLLGASTKGAIIGQFLGLNTSLVEAASDRDPNKRGLFTSWGGGIPIVSEEESRAMNPDLYLCFPYAFRSEMIQRERGFLARGGRIVFVLPNASAVTLTSGSLVEELL